MKKEQYISQSAIRSKAKIITRLRRALTKKDEALGDALCFIKNSADPSGKRDAIFKAITEALGPDARSKIRVG